MRRATYRALRRLYDWQTLLADRLTPLGRFVAASALAAAVFGIDTRANLIHQVFALTTSLLLIALLAALIGERRLRRELSAERALPRYASVGTPVRYVARLRVARRTSASGCAIAEQLPDPCPAEEAFLDPRFGADAGDGRFDRMMGYPRWLRLIEHGRWAEPIPAKTLEGVPAQHELTQTMHLTPRRRGYLRLTGISVTRPDPFGLVNSRVLLPCESSLLVLPRRYPAPRLALPGRRQHQPGGMTLASSVGDSQEVIGLREYRPGDSLRAIHWASWARSGKPQVKEHQDEFFTRHALALDTFVRDPLDPCFEAAVSVAASLCDALQEGDGLLDLLLVGAATFSFSAGRGLAGTEQLLEVLACAEPCTDRPFKQLERALLQRAGRLSAVVLVLLAFDAQRRSLVQRLRALGLPVRLLIVSEQPTAQLFADWPGERPRPIHPQRLAADLAQQ